MWLKICGMTTAAAIGAALEARVDAIGFVFAPSVRRLSPPQAARLAAAARGQVSCVAVTLHPTQALVDEIVDTFKPDMLQTDIADFDYLSLPSTLPRLPVVRTGTALALFSPPPARILFEGPRSGSGGIGNWQQAAELAVAAQLVLAGGLHAGNVAGAIHRVRPFGVDTSSGVEVVPGEKSAVKILEFVAAARAAFGEIEI